MAKIVISASSLPAGRNMSSQVEYIKKVQTYGADMYHLDVMDGKFVSSQTLDYNYLEQLRENSSLLFDVHLMVEAPKKSLIKKYIKNDSNIITLHYEAYPNKEKLAKNLQFIRKNGCMAGLSIDIGTSADEIMGFLPDIDLVLIMAVKVGAGGQKFNEDALLKIKQIRKANKNILIEVDGGVNPENSQKIIKAGADILAVGSYLADNDMYEAIQTLKGKN